MDTSRFFEMDFFRGIGVVMMVIYHFVFDWNFFIQPVVNLQSGFWFWFARTGSLLFVMGAGTVTYLYVRRKTNDRDIFSLLLKRGLFFLGFGVIITILSLLFFPFYTIWFGILHFIGLATILSIPFVHHPQRSLLVGLLLSLIGMQLSIYSGLLPPLIGLLPYSFQTFDYFPLFPWFGFFLLGIFIGQHFFSKKPGKWNNWIAEQPLLRWTTQLGQQSFTIYLFHQPIMIGGMLLLKFLL